MLDLVKLLAVLIGILVLLWRKWNLGLVLLLASLEALSRDGRVALAVIPGLIGMLPMIGGAIFSAPMVKEIGSHLQVDRNRMTYVNYWFRHVWEWVLPVYPTLILVAALLEIPPRDLALSQWPIMAAGIVIGIVI